MFEKEAEEWVKENMDCCKTDNSVNQSIPYFDEEERCCAKSAFKDGAEFGYNKGLEAGGSKWHDFRKNPKDLPEEEGEYLVCYKTDGGYRNTFILKYEEYDESLHWCDEVFDEGVIAWCEIPDFEEEVKECRT